MYRPAFFPFPTTLAWSMDAFSDVQMTGIAAASSEYMVAQMQRALRGPRPVTKVSVAWIVRGTILFVFCVLLWSSQRMALVEQPPNNNDGTTLSPPLVQPAKQTKQTVNPSLRNVDKNVTTVAYVATITSCGTDPNNKAIPFQIAEGAAVLRHSIARHQERYDYQTIIMYHPDAKACAQPLQDLGYVTLERNLPVEVKDIQGDFLRERIVKNGCCGEKELIKLQAWTLTDYPIVVLLDLDVLVLKPLDRLFDFLLDSAKLPDPDDLLVRPGTIDIPKRIEILYTTDYAMVGPTRKVKPTQGGFVVLRPSQKIYNDFVDIVRTGDFRESGGWLGKTGKFWGAMTFQGLMPLYFQILHPDTAVELNWCVWDNMASPSRDGKLVDGKPSGDCFTRQKNCEDCRNRPIEEVAVTHFTVCQKPWLCQGWKKDDITDRLCRAFHHAWFKERSLLEKSWGRSGMGPGAWDKDHFFGNCARFGTKGYHKIELPYGEAL